MHDMKLLETDARTRLRSPIRYSIAVLLATTALGVVSAHAFDGTWTGASGNRWANGNNWSSAPYVPGGVATFTATGPANPSGDGPIDIGGVVFAANAQAYTISVGDTFMVTGAGISNNSTNKQTFDVEGLMSFRNASSASAGTGAVTYNVNGGTITFKDSSTAGTAIINNIVGRVDFNASSTAGSATLTNGLTMTFNDSASAGSSTITNNGTLRFNGSAAASTANITNNRTLTFSDSSTAGNATITTNNGATTSFSKSSSGGNARLITNAGGTVDISGLTYHGTRAAGGLYIGTTVGSIEGAGNYVLGSNTLVTGSNNLSTQVDGVISGTGGSLEKVGTGTLTLTATNTYSGSTAIDSGGILALKGNGSIKSSRLRGAGTLDISQTTAGTSMQGLLSLRGGIISLGSKNLTVTAPLGSAFTGVIQDGGIGGGIGGSLTIASGVRLSLGGINTYTGTTTIAAGGDLSVGGAITMSGEVVYTSGTASIAASSEVIDDGLLKFGATAPSIKSLSGAATGIVDINAAGGDLTLTNAHGTFFGNIQGTNGIVLAAGTEVLAGVNTYTGKTTVNGGTLVVDGSIATSSLTTINSGATLAGSGTIGTTAVNGGTLAPGSTGGLFAPLTVAGSLSLTAASTYLIQVSPFDSGLTKVSGTANLGGAKVSAVFQPGSYVDKHYTIVTATGGLCGTTFNSAVTSNISNLRISQRYDANNAYLDVNLSYTPPTTTPAPPKPTIPTGLNINQQNVGNALVNHFNTAGSIPVAFAALSASGLTAVSGELGTGVIQSSINADSQFLNLLLDPTIAGRGAGFAAPGTVSSFADDGSASAYAMATKIPATKAPLLTPQPINRWSVWAAGYGGSARTDGNAVVGSQDTTSQVWGVAAGADYKISPDTLVGFALGGGGTNYSLANGLGNGSADLFQAGVYGRHNVGALYLSAALAYGWHDVTTTRTVTPTGFERLQSRFQAESFSARFEGGYRFATPLVALTPYAAAQVVNFNLPSYAEKAVIGTPMSALSYAGQTTTAVRTELGLRSDKSYALQDAVLTLRRRAAWAHDHNNDRAVTATFQSLSASSFVVNGASGKPDSALVSAGAEVKWLNGFSLAATFEGEFSSNVTSYAGKSVAKYSW